MRRVIVYERPSLAALRPIAALRRLREYSQLVSVLTRHRLRVRYVRTRLGAAWALVQPLSFMLVFTLMFSLIGRTPVSEVPYPLFAYAALVPWTGFASGVVNATSSLTSHSSLITKVAFPREVLPITYIVVALVDIAIASLALVALMAWYGVGLGPAILWLIPTLLLLSVFLAGLSLLLAALHVRYRDVGMAVPILLQVWMFLTPVIYPLDFARQGLPAGLYAVYVSNPMVAIVDGFRRATILNAAPDPTTFIAASTCAVLLLPLAYGYFKLVEQTMADVV